MTGSGKTGLCLSLLEEAAIDGIPVIAIDPKGDLGNLLLSFPELRGEDFAPWVDPDEAARKGLSREQYADQTAKAWREGLAAWGQDGGADQAVPRLRRPGDLHARVERGLPLTVLRSFAAPPPAWSARPRRIASGSPPRSRGCWRSWGWRPIRSPAASTSCWRTCSTTPGGPAVTSTWPA